MGFIARFDTSYEDKIYKKGSSLPYEARNIPAAIPDGKITLDDKIEVKKEEIPSFDFEKTISKKKLDKYAETFGLSLDGRKSLETMKEEIRKYLKRK